MARRKDPIIPDAILDQLLAGSDAKTAFDQNGLLDQLKKALTERALKAELDHHLAGDESGNRRNGYGRKTVLTAGGAMDLAIPRDRAGTFDPALIGKYQRRFLTRAEERARAIPGYKEGTFKRNTEIAEIAWKHLMGQSTENDASSVGATVGRIVRDFNFVRVMNQAGLSSIPELGNAVSQLGFKAIMAHVPEFKGMLSRARSGQLEDGVADELEKLFGGFGGGRLVTPVSNRMEEG